MKECKSIKYTGAKPGDTVKCISLVDEQLHGPRYIAGKSYPVKDWFGRPVVEGQRHGKKCGAGEEKWLIPFDGYGAVWKLE